MPRISVILTSYNCAPYLAQAIDSILAQTFADFELLISDDGSTDGSRDLIEDYARRDSRIIPYYQDQNLGLVRNYNFLFDRVAGDLVAIQDADDWSDLTRFASQVAVLDDPAYVLCGTAGAFHYPDGTCIRETGQQSAAIDRDAAASLLPASVMFRAIMLKQYPGWPIYFEGGTSMDRYYLMDLLDGRLGYHLAEPLYHARVRAGSNCRVWNARKMTSHALYLELARQRRQTGTDWLRDGDIAAMQRFEAAVGKERGLRAASMRDGAVINIDCGEYGAAASLLGRSLALNPLSALGWRSALYLARKWVGRASPRKDQSQ